MGFIVIDLGDRSFARPLRPEKSDHFPQPPQSIKLGNHQDLAFLEGSESVAPMHARLPQTELAQEKVAQGDRSAVEEELKVWTTEFDDTLTAYVQHVRTRDAAQPPSSIINEKCEAQEAWAREQKKSTSHRHRLKARFCKAKEDIKDFGRVCAWAGDEISFRIMLDCKSLAQKWKKGKERRWRILRSICRWTGRIVFCLGGSIVIILLILFVMIPLPEIVFG